MNTLSPAVRAHIRLGAATLAQRMAPILRSDWWRALFLLLIAIVVRAPSLSGEFLWDDEYLARDSPFIKSPLLALEVFRHHLFPDSFSGHYRPLQNLSFMADYFFWNNNTFGFHLTNLLLHAGSAVMLYFLVKRLLQAARDAAWLRDKSNFISDLAFFTALLWAVHPVHSAAVDYISGRADSLAFLFASSAWYLVFRARELKLGAARNLLFLSAALLGLLALCSRETAGLWLVIFLFHTLFFDPKISRRGKTWSVAICVALFALYLGLRQLPPARSGPGPSEGWGAPVRAVLMLRSLGDYGRLMIFPANLHMERTVVDGDNYRSHTTWENSVATEYLSIAGLIFAFLLIAGCCWRGNGRSLRIFGASWFMIGYLPTSNIVELNATSAEHWLYLPSAGLLIFLAGCVLDLPARYRTSLAALACLAAGGLSIRSALRSSDWVTPEVFYERTIAAGGDSMRVSGNLAELYTRRGQLVKAESLLRKVLAGTPDFPVARNNLARVYFEEGKTKEAEALFADSAKHSVEASKTYPRTWIAVLNFAHLLHATQRDDEALSALERARTDYPEVWEIVSLEAELLRQKKKSAAAFDLVSDFARDHWWHYGAALALGRLYAEAGDADRAVEALRTASWLDLHEVDALNLIAQMRLRQNRLVEAYRAQKRAVARQPDAPLQYALLSDILEKMGQKAEAKDAIAQVARLEAIGRPSRALPN